MDAIGEQIIGKKILFGLTYQYPDGKIKEQIQIFGAVEAVLDEGHTMKVACEYDTEPWLLPLHWPTMMYARRGKYTLSSTGIVVTNPDFIASWLVLIDPSRDEASWGPCPAPYHADVPKQWELEYVWDKAYLSDLMVREGSTFIGKSVLTGISRFQTNANGEENLVSREQFVGTISRLSYSEGVVLWVPAKNKEVVLPPDLTMFEPASQGEYILSSTQEVVKNVDFVSVWVTSNPS